MADKFFDFDAYMEERNNGDKPFIIRAFGEDHEIPNDVPFDVILTVQRAQKDGVSEFDDEQTLDMCKTIFGAETFDKWLKKGIGIKGIMVLTEQVMKQYMANAAETNRQMSNEKLNNHPKP